jgi:hypothetical protein
MEQNSAPQTTDASAAAPVAAPATTTAAAAAPAPAKRKVPTGWIVAMVASFAIFGTAAVFVAPHILWMFNGKKSVVKGKSHSAKGAHGVDVAHGEDAEEGDEEQIIGAHDSEDEHAEGEEESHASDDGSEHDSGHAQSHAGLSKTWMGRVFGVYGQAIDDIQSKVEEIRRLEHRLAAVELENLRLRTTMERSQFECRVAEASKHAGESRRRLAAETRTNIGRTLASIDYRIPEHLLPSQLYTLAVSYLHSRDNEKAVKILSHLMSLQDVDHYRNPKDYLLTGVAWYHIDNLEEADRYFSKVLESGEGKSDAATLPYAAQARLWRAIVAERSGKRAKSQYWMRELVDHHPHSTEAQWVNSKEARRAVAGGKKAANEPSDHGHH